jgi:hypothetical protein
VILTIGEKYHREGNGYTEELTVTGLDSIDDPLDQGEIVVPENGDSLIEARVINDITANHFTTTVKLRDLVNNWQEGELQ